MPNNRNLERDYYDPLIRFLTEEKECTKAVKLGSGSRTPRALWIPDVVGVVRSDKGAMRSCPDQIMSVEVKVDYDHLKGLGQACAYLLFSHKVYLATARPKTKQTEEQAAKSTFLEVLCQKYGIGLIYFSYKDDASTRRIDIRGYEIRARARHQVPDNLYVNRFLSENHTKFGELFETEES